MKANSILSALRRVLLASMVWVAGCVEEVIVPPPEEIRPAVQAVRVVPDTAMAIFGGRVQFADTVIGTGNFSKEVRWSAAAGSITQLGLYQAPWWAVVDTVYAKSVADTTKTGKALVHVIAGITSVTISPSAASVELYGTVQFTATVNGLPGANADVRWSARRGTVYAGGFYTAPATSGSDEVRAVSEVDTTKFAVASVNVTPLTAPKLLWTKFRNFGTMMDQAHAVAIDINNNIVVAGAKGSGGGALGAFAGFDTNLRERWVTELAYSSRVHAMVAGNARTEFFVSGAEGSRTKTLVGSIGMGGNILTDPLSFAFEGPGSGALYLFGNRLFVGEWKPGRLVITDLTGNILRTLEGNAVSSRIFGVWVTADHILVSGDFYGGNGQTNMAGYLRAFNHSDGLLWERIYDDVASLHVAEDPSGTIFVAGTFIKYGGGGQFILVAALDRDGNELWKVMWDGGQGGSHANWVEGLILNPSGGVVALGPIQELPGNPKCTTLPNCWDFGLWAVGSGGETRWTLRQGFGQSPWDYAEAAAFDLDGNLVVVGMATPNPTGRDATDNVDWVIAKFAIPR